ncbi:right-handed parallel beta-helix repeat-containing protein [Psychroserpens algicola]|uniref:Right-handed parallel beta-helix repeat-containing protein n=1 Tax=Psychroserpens algicola TaxID=1719034 RepID=A0ABT0H588_9FLAO|nr:right-handed parallel beta-helix repeat-containing protein [Psychroserpens algicola]MCK8479537.1 right-handed parallel beta-helix repeat-containing protein [Psychroserpens algicola]
MMLLQGHKASDKKDEKRFFLVVYVFVLLFGVYSGMYCYRFGIVVDVKHHLQAAHYDFPTYFKYLTSSSDNNFDDIAIDFKFKDYIKLSNQRSRFVYSNSHFFEGKQWLRRESTYAKATIKYNQKKFDVKAKLFGKNNDHFRHPYKWSFRVKAKDYIKDFKNGKFNLLQPNTRLYITDVICNRVLQQHNILSLEYKPVNLTINDRPTDLYFIEDFFSKYLIERNGYRDSFIFTFSSIKHPSLDKLNDNQLRDIDEIKNNIINTPEIILDQDKFDKVLALLFLAQNKHPYLVDNFHMFYNNVTNKVEPIVREVWFKDVLTLSSKEDLKGKLIEFITYVSDYNKNLNAYLSSIVNNEKRLGQVMATINTISKNLTAIRSTPDWQTFQDAIYSRYPQAIYLCKNIEINVNAVLSLNLDEQKKKLIPNRIKQIETDTKLEDDMVLYDTDLSLSPGITLDLNGHHIILVSGHIRAVGEATNAITITNSSEAHSSIVVKQSKTPNKFAYVNISKLSNFDDSYWHLPAGITFYESEVLMNHVAFESNRAGDDFVNFFRCSDFNLSNVSFTNVNADAIDSDFSNGTIDNCNFLNIGNDAVDGSGSQITITNSRFNNVEDKVISAGENSTMHIANSTILNSEISFVSKDDSTLSEQNNTLINNTLDYCLFNKKKEFDNGSLYTDKNILQTKYLIEKGSKVYKGAEELMNLKMVDSVKESLYGIEYGKKSR